MMLKYIVVLRIEQGFPDSLYDTDDQALKKYADHHRLVLSSIAAYDAAYDIHNQSESGINRLEKVLSGIVRSATLCVVLEDPKDAPRDKDWIGVRDYLGIDESSEGLSPWRVEKDENDQHHYYDEYGVWSATRTLSKIGDDFRVRERYTFTAKTSVGTESIVGVVNGETEKIDPTEDVLLATATVYALDKAISKPQVEMPEVDWSRYPALNSLRNQK
jgi:hypothetical protein